MRGCPDNRVTRFWQSCHYKVVKHINIGIRIPGSSQSCHSILAMILLDLDSRVTRCEHVSVLIADNTLIRLAPAIFVSTSEKSKNKIKCILISIYNYIYELIWTYKTDKAVGSFHSKDTATSFKPEFLPQRRKIIFSAWHLRVSTDTGEKKSAPDNSITLLTSKIAFQTWQLHLLCWRKRAFSHLTALMLLRTSFIYPVCTHRCTLCLQDGSLRTGFSRRKRERKKKENFKSFCLESILAWGL